VPGCRGGAATSSFGDLLRGPRLEQGALVENVDEQLVEVAANDLEPLAANQAAVGEPQ
jgi:hypothetical protein